MPDSIDRRFRRTIKIGKASDLKPICNVPSKIRRECLPAKNKVIQPGPTRSIANDRAKE
jgi:hypothetical protein